MKPAKVSGLKMCLSAAKRGLLGTDSSGAAGLLAVDAGERAVDAGGRGVSRAEGTAVFVAGLAGEAGGEVV